MRVFNHMPQEQIKPFKRALHFILTCTIQNMQGFLLITKQTATTTKPFHATFTGIFLPKPRPTQQITLPRGPRALTPHARAILTSCTGFCWNKWARDVMRGISLRIWKIMHFQPTVPTQKPTVKQKECNKPGLRRKKERRKKGMKGGKDQTK